MIGLTCQELPPDGCRIGWTFLLWADFDARWTSLIAAVATLRASDPSGYTRAPEARMLKALIEIMRDRIARDPNAADARLRADLGAWRRIKFFGRFRLFYRFDSATRTVILTWLNDEDTLRKAGVRTDPYVVFAGMLARGVVPSGWAELEAGATRLRPPLPMRDETSAETRG